MVVCIFYPRKVDDILSLLSNCASGIPCCNMYLCNFRRCEFHCKSSIHGGSWQCGGSCSRSLSEEPRCLLVLPKPHKLLVAGHSQWSGMQMHILKKSMFECGKCHWFLYMLVVQWCLFSFYCVLAGLLAGMSGADRITTRVQPAASSAAQQHIRN